MCPILKKLTRPLQPYREVTRLIDEILESERGNDCRVLEHLLSFAEHQFGKGVPGKHYRERENGERISNWQVEIDILNKIIRELCYIYEQDNSLSSLVQNDMAYPYQERSLSLLNSWLINLDLDASEGNGSISEDQKIILLRKLYYTEQNMAAIATDRRQIDLAEEHCQRCLAYSRRYGLEGEEKTTMMFSALRSCCNLRKLKGNLVDALTFAEECYNLVVEAYDPVHPQVQEAAGVLINILISKGDLFDAERYAQVTYGNLRDKKNGIDQESEAVAMGASNLADVIYRQKGDLIKAEELARESLRIRTLIHGIDDHCIGMSCNLLAGILKRQGQLGDETKGLYERCLATFILNFGPDGSISAAGNYNLGLFYCKLAEAQTTVDLEQKQLLLAKGYFEESHRIRLKIHGPTHTVTVDTASTLAIVLSELSEIELL
jgi:hypothetical protein